MTNKIDNNNDDQNLDDSMTELMQAHLDDVTGAASSHNSWKQNKVARELD
jgi:hypothetical protein